MTGDPWLSVVVPAWQEAGGIVETLQALASWRMRGVEVIVADGGSPDGTARLAAPHADRVIVAPRGRARQMNAGASVARAPLLLFLHADTRLPAQGDRRVREALRGGSGWGRFDVRIAGRSPLLRVVAFLMNRRSRWTGIATGDQAIFVSRDLFERVGTFPDQPLMEDVALCRRLRALARPCCLRDQVITSGRRWEKNGVLRTIVLMWRLRWRYWRGESPQTLADDYR